MLKFLKKFSNFLLDLVFPIECLACGRENEYLCVECFEKLKFSDSIFLEKAKTNLNIEQIDKIFIAGDYDNPILKKLITNYKYKFMHPLGKILASFLIKFWKLENAEIETANFKISKLKKEFIIIPAPLSKERLRWRGFNQAELIARDFSTYFNYELNLNLKKIKNIKPQAELSESERLKNIKSVFSYEGESLKNKTILLIDDVITTGATLNEAARVLKEANAKEIYALVLAKG